MKILSKNAFLFFTFFNLTTAFAFPKAPIYSLSELSKSIDDQRAFEASEYDFEGIVKLSNCSGALIRFNGQPTTSKAIVLTNGHCYLTGAYSGMLKPGEVAMGRTLSRDLKLFNDQKRAVNVKAVKVLYATMTNTDIALYELAESYDSIMSRFKIEPFTLESSRPLIGMSIDIISGYWERGYSCELEAFVFELREENYMFRDSIRYSPGCNTVGGTSGSPILLKGTRNVIAINNTANENGKRCTMNNPCEINESGVVTVLKDKKYGQQTYNIYSCLRPDFQIDLALPGCTLPRPKS